MKHAFHGFDRFYWKKTCCTAGDLLLHSSPRIKMPWLERRFISALSPVRQSMVWRCSSYQGDPIGSHLAVAKLRSIPLEMLSGTMCWALNLKHHPDAKPCTSHIFNWANVTPCAERGAFFAFFFVRQSTYDEFRDSLLCMIRRRTLWLIHADWKFNGL